MIKRRKEGKKEKERDMLIKIRKKLKGGMKREDGNKNTHTHTQGAWLISGCVIGVRMRSRRRRGRRRRRLNEAGKRQGSKSHLSSALTSTSTTTVLDHPPVLSWSSWREGVRVFPP